MCSEEEEEAASVQARLISKHDGMGTRCEPENPRVKYIMGVAKNNRVVARRPRVMIGKFVDGKITDVYPSLRSGAYGTLLAKTPEWYLPVPKSWR